MRKLEGAVGEEARALVNKWKEMVAAEDKSDSDAQEDSGNYQSETLSDHNSNNTSPKQSKRDKDAKRKESPKEKSREHATSPNRKSGSSRDKSPERHSSKSSKGSEKRKSLKDGESSKSSSKQSRKRHHSQEDTNSTAEEEAEEEDGPTLSFADALGSIETVSKKKKNKDKDKEKSRQKKKTVSSPDSEIPFIPPQKTGAAPLPSKSLDIRVSDFEISPHYKPLPLRFVTDFPAVSKEKSRTAEEALSVAMAQKGSR